MRITWDELKGEFQSDYSGKVQLKGERMQVIRVPPGEYHILYKEIFLRIKKYDLKAFINYLKKKFSVHEGACLRSNRIKVELLAVKPLSLRIRGNLGNAKNHIVNGVLSSWLNEKMIKIKDGSNKLQILLNHWGWSV